MNDNDAHYNGDSHYIVVLILFLISICLIVFSGGSAAGAVWGVIVILSIPFVSWCCFHNSEENGKDNTDER